MRNVLTAGDTSPRTVDQFLISRASRWKNKGGGAPSGGGGDISYNLNGNNVNN